MNPLVWLGHLPHFGFFRLTFVAAILWLTLVGSHANADSLALLDGDVLFGAGEFQLTDAGKQSLETLTQTLHGFDGILSIRLIGHTDDRGDPEANTALSQRRANRLAKHFKKLFPGTHILSLGAGDSIPRFSNLSAEGRARNRRVQIQVIANGNASVGRQ